MDVVELADSKVLIYISSVRALDAVLRTYQERDVLEKERARGCILTFDPAKHAIPKTAEVTHSDGSYGKKSRRRAWLTIWDKVKSHGTVID